ncbi:MAG TPA: S8 family serine peptidase [Pyrinomonadaceae bacterium]|jgi:subtilisin family serine protease
MNHTLKVFVTGEEQDRLPDVKVVERYDGFVLVEAPEDKVEELKRSYLLEDITPLYTIQTRKRKISTSRPRLDKEGVYRPHASYRGEKPPGPGPHHYLVQFVGPVKESWLKAVRRAGGETRASLGDFTFVVRADDEQIKKIAALDPIRWVGRYDPQDRIDPSVFKSAGRKEGDIRGTLPRTKLRPGVYTVEFFGADDTAAAVKEVKKLGFRVLADEPSAKLLVVETDTESKDKARGQLEALARVHGVRAIHERPVRRPANDVAAGIMRTAAALGGAGLNLSGRGEVIAVCDTGLDSGNASSIHPDFQGRVEFIKSYPINPTYTTALISNPGGNDGAADLDSGHGTHVAGSVLGSGASSAGLAGLVGPVRGLAYKARLVFQAVEQEMKWKNPANLTRYGRYLLTGIPVDLRTLFADAYAKGARIHSNSWGGGEPGDYDDQCRQLDAFVWDRKNFCVLVAAGNDGTDDDGDGVINAMSVTSPGTAKNCITVGACENARPAFTSTYGSNWPRDYPAPPFNTDKVADNPDQIVAFSSRGPTRDGRIKPEVVAPGTYILSTRSRSIAPNNFGWGRFPSSTLYMYDSGTSMATPLTAGAVALLREYLRTKQHIGVPSAALLKAALIAGATRLPGSAVQGAVCDNDQGFGRVNIDAVVAPKSPAKFVFFDQNAGLKTGQVHTVSLTLKSGGAPLVVVVAYTDFPGKALVNNLNLIVRGPNNLVVGGNQTPGAPPSLDANNNVEVVRLDAPAAGAYTIQVVASNIPQGPQPFALVYSGHL